MWHTHCKLLPNNVLPLQSMSIGAVGVCHDVNSTSLMTGHQIILALCLFTPSWHANGPSLHALANRTHLWCRDMMACLAVSGESEAEPGAFLTGANSDFLGTSIRDTFSARGMVSNIKSSSLIPYDIHDMQDC